jgi:hypothetical protein
MKKTYTTLFFTSWLLLMASCELNLLDNPNRLTPDQASTDFLLNSVQLKFADFFRQATDLGMDITRMQNMTGRTYNNSHQSVDFDAMWNAAYSDMFPDINVVLDKAEKGSLHFHAGMVKALKAYALITLVDYYGDIPFSEANNASNFNPRTDAGQSVYDAALVLLENAEQDFSHAPIKPGTDMFYAGSAAKWIALCNTLKLKIFIQTRLVDVDAKNKINALIASAPLIDETDGSEDFTFFYPATSFSNPTNYHPWFLENYKVTGAEKYQSNFYLKEMYRGKSVVDPRMRYYFYRQTLTVPTSNILLLCAGTPRPPHYSPSMVYCSVEDGYYGRDHLDPNGAPPDNLLRTNYGLYPAGGKFDDNSAKPNGLSDGAKGKGIWPIMLASYVSFMKAEAALTLNQNSVEARTFLEEGIRKSITKVTGFNADVVNASFAPTPATINSYVNDVLTKYDGENADGKLDVIIKEYWIALYGNGIEAYNTYRRTAHPVGLQPPLTAAYGDFWRSFLYPAVYVLRNSNARQKADPTTQVFWDVNPASSSSYMY